jgi:hypothetical protein
MSATLQPVWAYRFNLGDANPVDHGGFFVFEDTTGAYPPEAVYLTDTGEEDEYGDPAGWIAYRLVLEPCTYVNGILSDNRFHPDKPAWFAGTEDERKARPQDTTYLANVASYADYPDDSLARAFCSEELHERANAWRAVGEYHGFDNLDSYPLTFTDREELESWLKDRGIDV